MSKEEVESGFHRLPTKGKGWPGHVALTIDVDVTNLRGYTDTYLATIWHTAQAARAPYGDDLAADVVRQVTIEIVRRWLGAVGPELHHHLADAPATAARSALGTYRPGGTDDLDGDFHGGVWRTRGEVIDAILAGPPPGTVCPYCGTDGTPNTTSSTGGAIKILDQGAAGLSRVEYGPGAGEVWICRDNQACKTRVYRAADTDNSLVCARCNRHPGVAAAPTELHPIATDGEQRWVCVDTKRCDRRIARGASPPFRFDREAQARVAELRAAREAGTK
jgi:hypothetical protein